MQWQQYSTTQPKAEKKNNTNIKSVVQKQLAIHRHMSFESNCAVDSVRTTTKLCKQINENKYKGILPTILQYMC